MPYKPKKPCAYPGCPLLIPAGETYCNRHKSERQHKYRIDKPSSWKVYGRLWNRLRKIKLYRNPYCEICGKVATEVDHIVPIRKGGLNELDNLQSLCKSCHSRKTAKYDGGFGKRKIN